MDLFGAFRNKQTPVQQQQPAADPNAVVDPNADPTKKGVNPDPKDPKTNVDPNASPLDAFKDLFDTKKQDPTKAPKGIFEGPIDINKLTEAASKLNFLSGVTPETEADIAAGGEKAVAAMKKIVNQAVQLGYAHSIALNRNVIEAVANKIEGRLAESLPEKLKYHNLQDSTLESNPAFNHPAVTPVIKAITAQFANQYPEASQKELQSGVLQFLTEISKVIVNKDGGSGNSGTGNSGKGSVSADEDFSEFEKIVTS